MATKKEDTSQDSQDSPVKITSLDQVKTILERLVELMEDEPKEDSTNEEDDSKDNADSTSTDSKPSDEPQDETKKGDFEAEAEIISKSPEERIAYSIAYPAMPAGWTDTQSDWISEGEIRRMAHNWMVNSGSYDIQHKILNVAKEDASVVESFIAPTDINWPIGNNTYKLVTKGSWVVATKFSPKLWNMVKSGEISAYSIRGKARREKIK